MFEDIYNGYIKTGTSNKVKKSTKSINLVNNNNNNNNMQEFIKDNIGLINNIIDNGKFIVRKNHLTKKCFRILTLNVDYKLDKNLFAAINKEIYNRHKANYLPPYGGWVIEELLYEPDKPKSIKEMQEAFLAKNTVNKIDGNDIDYLSKDLNIYKSKTYINREKDYKEKLQEMVHIYDNLRFMTPDGSIDVLFRFKRLVTESKKSSAIQTIYYITQTNNKTDKSKVSTINELNIPLFLEQWKMVAYDYNVCNNYYKNYSKIKYGSKSGKTVNINGNRYTIDDDWEEDKIN